MNLSDAISQLLQNTTGASGGSPLSVSANSSLWLFLPFSSADGLVARLERALGELRSGDGGAHALQVTTRALQLPRDGRKGERATALMERLRAR